VAGRALRNVGNAMNATQVYADPKHASRFANAVLLSIASAAFFLHPYALLLFACLVAVVSPTKDFKWLLLLATCALFTLLNVSKELDGDLVVYVNLLDYVSQKPFLTLLDKDELQLISGTYRATELGFYAPLWLMSQILQDSNTTLAIAATLGIYIPTFLALDLIGKSENWAKGLIITVALFTFFAGINFIQTTHLIRQYISSALLFYAFALFVSKRHRRAALIALCACTVHNGSALLIPLVAAVCWMFRRREGAQLGMFRLIFCTVIAVGLLVVTMAIVPILGGDTTGQDIPNIHVGHYLVVGAFFIIAQIAVQMQRLRIDSLYYGRLCFVTIYVLSLGFFIVGLPLFALRYFAYLEWLYGLMVGAIMYTWFRQTPPLRMYARLTVSLAAAAILVERITVSEWMYGPGDNYLLGWGFFQVTQLVSR
jgi:EpsG family